MTKLPVVSGEEVTRALARVGFVEVSQRGSHVKMRHPDGPTTIVPMHRELRMGTLRSICRQAKLTVDEFKALLEH